MKDESKCTDEELKRQIYEKARDLGAELVNCCSVEKWQEIPQQKPEFYPQNIWPWSEKVIVLGIPLFAPMIDTTPSIVYQELYTTSNKLLDEMAYRLSSYIVTQLGYKAIFFPRDCYYGIDDLVANPSAAFSHVLAAYYAGMGTIGDSHNLITPEFGPRVRMVSIITDAPIAADPMIEKDLCIHCGQCLKHCPSNCFRDTGDPVYDMDKVACTKHHVTLKNEHHWPCGICIDVCPVGNDLKMYAGTKRISADGTVHCRSFGSSPAER